VTADILLQNGRIAEASDFVDRAEAFQRATDERSSEAEILRQRGVLLELGGDVQGAQQRYRHAIALASERGALLFELRAAEALARSCAASSEAESELAHLKAVCGRLTEASRLPDLKRAQAFLQQRGLG